MVVRKPIEEEIMQFCKRDIKQQFSIKLLQGLINHSIDRTNAKGLLKPYLILYIF